MSEQKPTQDTEPSIFDTIDERIGVFPRYVQALFRGNTVATVKTLVANTAKVPAVKVLSEFRPAAYTSEVGEAGRPILNKYFVNAAYGISILYVLADIMIKTHDNHVAGFSDKKLLVNATDLLAWHAAASMILPAVTIHSIVKYSGIGLSKINVLNNMPKLKGALPVVIGLASIPLIIHPIDDIVDYFMDKFTRPFYNDEYVPRKH